MPDYPIPDLEEQLRQDRRLGKARRRRRRMRRLLPILAVLLTAAGIVLLLTLTGREEETGASETYAPGSAVATLNFVGDISLD